MTNINKPVCGVKEPVCRTPDEVEYVECYRPHGHEKHHEGRWGKFTVAWPQEGAKNEDVSELPRSD